MRIDGGWSVSRRTFSSPSSPTACTPRSLGVCKRAPRLTARSVLEGFAAVQMIDVRVPTTTDGNGLQLTPYAQPELQLLLMPFPLELPAQPEPKIAAAAAVPAAAV